MIKTWLRGSEDLESFMDEVRPASEARTIERPMILILPYIGPQPEREHAKVCIVKSKVLEKTNEIP